MLARGDVALSVTMTATSSVITLFTLPFIMELASHVVSQQTGAEVNLPVSKLLVQNIVLLFVPIAAGAAFRRIAPKAASRVNKVLGKAAFPLRLLMRRVFLVGCPAAERFFLSMQDRRFFPLIALSGRWASSCRGRPRRKSSLRGEPSSSTGLSRP